MFFILDFMAVEKAVATADAVVFMPVPNAFFILSTAFLTFVAAAVPHFSISSRVFRRKSFGPQLTLRTASLACSIVWPIKPITMPLVVFALSFMPLFRPLTTNLPRSSVCFDGLWISPSSLIALITAFISDLPSDAAADIWLRIPSPSPSLM